VDWWHLRWDACVARSRRALELAEAANDEQTELYARTWLARDAAMHGRAPEARAHSTISLGLADRLRERYWAGTTCVNAFWLAALEGKWAEARFQSDAGLRAQPRDARNLGLRAVLEHQLGNHEDGEAFLGQLVDAMAATTPGSTIEHAAVAAFIPLAAHIRGEDDGRLALAVHAADIAMSPPAAIPVFDLYVRVGLGATAVETGDAVCAEEQYRALESQRGTALIAVGIAADRLLGLLALTMREIGIACAHFEAALAFCERAGYRPEYARAAIDCARALSERAGPGDATRAAALGGEGMELAGELGLRDLAGRGLSAPGGIVPHP
jgi:hypothetical protein